MGYNLNVASHALHTRHIPVLGFKPASKEQHATVWAQYHKLLPQSMRNGFPDKFYVRELRQPEPYTSHVTYLIESVEVCQYEPFVVKKKWHLLIQAIQPVHDSYHLKEVVSMQDVIAELTKLTNIDDGLPSQPKPSIKTFTNYNLMPPLWHQRMSFYESMPDGHVLGGRVLDTETQKIVEVTANALAPALNGDVGYLVQVGDKQPQTIPSKRELDELLEGYKLIPQYKQEVLINTIGMYKIDWDSTVVRQDDSAVVMYYKRYSTPAMFECLELYCYGNYNNELNRIDWAFKVNEEDGKTVRFGLFDYVARIFEAMQQPDAGQLNGLTEYKAFGMEVLTEQEALLRRNNNGLPSYTGGPVLSGQFAYKVDYNEKLTPSDSITLYLYEGSTGIKLADSSGRYSTKVSSPMGLIDYLTVNGLVAIEQ